MSFLCGCFTSSNGTSKSELSGPRGRPEMRQQQHPSHNHHAHGNGVVGDHRYTLNSGDSASGEDDGYFSVPLPRYTPRPMSIQEKTLAAHMRDPSISSAQYEFPADEKHAYEAEAEEGDMASNPDRRGRAHEELTSDASSAFSFPSTFGNTSTATRETPPPPYSPRPSSSAPSRPMSICESSSVMMAMGVVTAVTPPPMARIAPPRSTYISRNDSVSTGRSPDSLSFF